MLALDRRVKMHLEPVRLRTLAERKVLAHRVTALRLLCPADLPVEPRPRHALEHAAVNEQATCANEIDLDETVRWIPFSHPLRFSLCVVGHRDRTDRRLSPI